MRTISLRFLILRLTFDLLRISEVNSVVVSQDGIVVQSAISIDNPEQCTRDGPVVSVSKYLQDSHNCMYQKSLTEYESFLLMEKILAEEKTNLLEPSSCDDAAPEFNSPTEIYSGDPQVSANCSSDLNIILKAAKLRLQWALKMIDATGKPISGILQGNRHFVGDFDECMEVQTGYDFEGQYCSINIIISHLKGTALATPPNFQLGLCFPSSCDARNVEEVVNAYLKSRSDITAKAEQINCHERHLPLTDSAKIAICIISVFAMLVVVATFYDLYWKNTLLKQKEQQNSDMDEDSQVIKGNEKKAYKSEIWDYLLMSFSVKANTAKLFFIDGSDDSLDCIHGLKFLHTTWIILLHTYVMGAGSLGNAIPFVEKAENSWTFKPVLKSAIAVDGFFAIGGILMIQQVFKKLVEEKLTLKFIWNFYLHRYLRLTPTCMLIFLTCVPLYKYTSNGPFWPQQGVVIGECDSSWWTIPTYLNNFINEESQCMLWTWYSACDLQFYLVSPLLFLPLIWYDKRGLIVPFVVLLANAVCSGVISNNSDLDIDIGFPMLRGITPGMFFHYKYYYVKPYTRIGPFIIGIVTGFLLLKSSSKARPLKILLLLGWVVAILLAFAVMYGLQDRFEPEDGPSTKARALYNALHRIAWGTSVCWVIFICVKGYGGG